MWYTNQRVISYELQIIIPISCVYYTSYKIRVTFFAWVSSFLVYTITSYRLLHKLRVSFLHATYEWLLIARVTSWFLYGLFEKLSTLDPINFYAILFQKLVFLISLYRGFLEKKNKEIKKGWFLVNSSCFCFAFHANLMSDGKKKRFKYLFKTPLILLINMSISLFRWTV